MSLAKREALRVALARIANDSSQQQDALQSCSIPPEPFWTDKDKVFELGGCHSIVYLASGTPVEHLTQAVAPLIGDRKNNRSFQLALRYLCSIRLFREDLHILKERIAAGDTDENLSRHAEYIAQAHWALGPQNGRLLLWLAKTWNLKGEVPSIDYGQKDHVKENANGTFFVPHYEVHQEFVKQAETDEPWQVRRVLITLRPGVSLEQAQDALSMAMRKLKLTDGLSGRPPMTPQERRVILALFQRFRPKGFPQTLQHRTHEQIQNKVFAALKSLARSQKMSIGRQTVRRLYEEWFRSLGGVTRSKEPSGPAWTSEDRKWQQERSALKVRRQRTCLRCDKSFLSSGANNHVCPTCSRRTNHDTD